MKRRVKRSKFSFWGYQLLTPLQKEEKKDKEKRRIKKWKRTSKDFIIGSLIGELIWGKMPTHTLNGVLSGYVIEVSEEDKQLEKELELELEKTQKRPWAPYDKNDIKFIIAWSKWIKFRRYLDKKYLPKTFEFTIHEPITICEDFKRGIINNLWNQDGCTYSLNPWDIEIKTYLYYTKIIFRLDKVN